MADAASDYGDLPSFHRYHLILAGNSVNDLPRVAPESAAGGNRTLDLVVPSLITT